MTVNAKVKLDQISGTEHHRSDLQELDRLVAELDCSDEDGEKEPDPEAVLEELEKQDVDALSVNRRIIDLLSKCRDM
jgi:hypothetical protein